jgi:hypothetical protein
MKTSWDYHFDEYDWNEKEVVTAAKALGTYIFENADLTAPDAPEVLAVVWNFDATFEATIMTYDEPYAGEFADKLTPRNLTKQAVEDIGLYIRTHAKDILGDLSEGGLCGIALTFDARSPIPQFTLERRRALKGWRY